MFEGDQRFEYMTKTPVACKGEHYNAVHLRSFGSRYPRTPNPPSEDESFPVLFTGYSHNRAKQALSYVN
ncbi:hypothetical protein ACP179_08580 [Xenorhabdus stockiae]|uniref:hypothetical protein n=1 Tax=Xenorhabdus stockiae TaxID=351614 RepID=UPI003CF90674